MSEPKRPQLPRGESGTTDNALSLPTVPTDATCGGCRYYKENFCYSEPEVFDRSKFDPACRHYEEDAK